MKRKRETKETKMKKGMEKRWRKGGEKVEKGKGKAHKRAEKKENAE